MMLHDWKQVTCFHAGTFCNRQGQQFGARAAGLIVTCAYGCSAAKQSAAAKRFFFAAWAWKRVAWFCICGFAVLLLSDFFLLRCRVRGARSRLGHVSGVLPE